MESVSSKKNSIVNVIMTTEVVLFDPVQCKGYQQFQIVNLFLDTLVRKDPKFGIISGAASKWDINASQTEYTFYLNQNLKFHNEDTITAKDVKYSFDRHLEEGSVSVIGTYLKNVLLQIEIVSDFSVKFVLKGSYPPFLDLISMPGYGIISSKSTKDKIIGSGPFVRSESKSGMVCLTKRKNYPFSTTNIDKFCIKIERDVEKTIAALNDSSIQLAMGSPLEVALSEKLKMELVSHPTFSLVSTQIFLNHNSSFLKEKKNRQIVRKIAYSARDNDKILTKFDSALNTYIPKGIMQESYYQDEPFINVNDSLKEKTKLKIVFPYGIFLESSVKKIVKRFEIAGFEVSYLNVKGKDLLAPIQSGEFDLVFVPYQGVIPDPDGYLDLLAPESLLKKASIPSEKYLKKISDARFTTNRKDRLDEYSNVLKKFEKELYIIPFSQNSIPIVYNNKLKLPNLNYTFHLNLRELTLK
ncbi:MAG: hypothetical protein A3D17_07960 [Bdellovibrionales bacterium RIFCSPHIGHO2_02_FULL_40_15]|nr:MAG: hypothetical protein A3D17_07960 [Bdellovibrionales bacterium RIFCSPHIGHO2_02_FULL_40_15]